MILVFGKTGQVAMELQSVANVIALDRDQADLASPNECLDIIRSYNPSAVINAAAYTAVDKAEDEEILATKINGKAPALMAQACFELNIPFVHISTDYVFEGLGNRPWKNNDLTYPCNAYGRSKLLGEEGIRSSGATYCILRTSWIVSEHGVNFVKTMLRLSETRNKLDVVADQIGGPSLARDIAITCLIIADQLQKDPKKSGTYHYSGAPDVSWADFAAEIFHQSGRKIIINPIKAEDYPTTAVRPLNSRLDCNVTEKTFGIKRPDWRKNLIHILQNLEVIK